MAVELQAAQAHVETDVGALAERLWADCRQGLTISTPDIQDHRGGHPAEPLSHDPRPFPDAGVLDPALARAQLAGVGLLPEPLVLPLVGRVGDLALHNLQRGCDIRLPVCKPRMLRDRRQQVRLQPWVALRVRERDEDPICRGEHTPVGLAPQGHHPVVLADLQGSAVDGALEQRSDKPLERGVKLGAICERHRSSSIPSGSTASDPAGEGGRARGKGRRTACHLARERESRRAWAGCTGGRRTNWSSLEAGLSSGTRYPKANPLLRQAQ